MKVTLEVGKLATPIGEIVVAVRDEQVCALGFGAWSQRQLRFLAARFGDVALAPAADPGGIVTILRRYFAGELDVLGRVAVDLGGTEFQRLVWQRLRKIPAGSTLSYSALARDIGQPLAVRAVGAANGANPVGLIVPCHRVVGADGRLTGYAGGLSRKRWLLAHEADACALFRATS